MEMPDPKPLRIFFSAGEPSGDLHGANLIRALKQRSPGFEAVGFGGPEMASAGCRLLADLTALAVMWFLRVFLNLHKFYGLLREADRYFGKHRPDAVVLIDYPGFNWKVAQAAKRHGIPVFYYVPPQIWAWGSWRIKKMRRYVDHVLCCLPFEHRWFVEQGCEATLVGHPFFDEILHQPLDGPLMDRIRSRPGPLVVILPGSRNQEVEGNLGWFLKAAQQVQAAVPDVRLAVAAFKPEHARLAQQELKRLDLVAEAHCGKTPELIRLADCAMACSGSVSLELLCHAKPTVILYKISRLSYFVQSLFRRVRYITLVNLLATDELHPKDMRPFDPAQPDAERVLFPEYLTWEDKSGQIARHVIEWLTDPARYLALVEKLERLKAEVAVPGASDRAARFLIERLRGEPASAHS